MNSVSLFCTLCIWSAGRAWCPGGFAERLQPALCQASVTSLLHRTHRLWTEATFISMRGAEWWICLEIVFKPLMLLMPLIKMARYHKEKHEMAVWASRASVPWPLLLPRARSGHSCIAHSHLHCERLLRVEEICVERVNTEFEKSGSVVIVQGEEWEIKWYLFRSLPYCSLHCSFGIFYWVQENQQALLEKPRWNYCHKFLFFFHGIKSLI